MTLQRRPGRITLLDNADPEAVLRVLESIRVSVDMVHDIVCVSPDDALVLAYPSNGSMRAVPAGQTSIDFTRGLVQRPDAGENIIGNLASMPDTLMTSVHGKYIRSLNLLADVTVDVEVLYLGRTSGKFNLRQGVFASLASLACDQLVINSSYPFNLQVIASTLPAPVATIQTPNAFMERYGTMNTIDAFQIAQLGPTQGGALGSAFLGGTLYTAFMGQKIFAVVNSGANGININVQLLLSGSGTWADDPVTGSALALASGNTALIETGIPTQFNRIRLQNQTLGSPSSATVSFFATTLIR